MLPVEIIEILEKYSNYNKQAFININGNIDEIISNLNLFNESMSSQLQYLLSNHKTNSTNELYQDCITLCNYIDSLKTLDESYSEQVASNEVTGEDSNHHSKTPMPKPVKLFLCDDNICPACECNMIETHTMYTKKVNKNLMQRKIFSYKCDCCHKYFIPDYDAVDLDIIDTNLIFDTKYYDKLTLFDEVYVVTNINHHSSNNHELKDMDGKLCLILPNGNIITRIVNITYCSSCKKYYMLKSTYDSLTGVPICSIVDETKERQVSPDGFIFDSKGSKLTQYGYNVNCIDKLTDIQRQKF